MNFQYEGNSSGLAFEDLTAGTETMRFWDCMGGGKYCGHSEILLANLTDNPSQTTQFWWNYGGDIRGQSPNMIKFMKAYMTDIDTYKHPPFSELTEKCLVWEDDNNHKNGCVLTLEQL